MAILKKPNSAFKKSFLVLFVFLILTGNFQMYTSAFDYTRKSEEINIRDPYILVYDGKYYMYGTGLSGVGYGCAVSEDLEYWSNSINIFTPAADFEGDGCYWAPECHYYNGCFYLFATFHSKNTGYRGVGIFKSNSPTGPFELISDGHITPHDRDCIDGTLYVDESGTPWMVYVNEWTSNDDGVGTMAAARMSSDLTHFEGEGTELFRADGHIWTDSKVTDGPFMYKTKAGKLIMLWSNNCKSGGYAVGLCRSSNGNVNGKYIHSPFALYKKDKKTALDGGHAMLFTSLDGQLKMAIHSPNSSGDGLFERAVFIDMVDTGSVVKIKGSSSKIRDIFTEIYFSLMGLFVR